MRKISVQKNINSALISIGRLEQVTRLAQFPDEEKLKHLNLAISSLIDFQDRHNRLEKIREQQ